MELGLTEEENTHLHTSFTQLTTKDELDIRLKADAKVMYWDKVPFGFYVLWDVEIRSLNTMGSVLKLSRTSKVIFSKREDVASDMTVVEGFINASFNSLQNEVNRIMPAKIPIPRTDTTILAARIVEDLIKKER